MKVLCNHSESAHITYAWTQNAKAIWQNKQWHSRVH